MAYHLTWRHVTSSHVMTRHVTSQAALGLCHVLQGMKTENSPLNKHIPRLQLRKMAQFPDLLFVSFWSRADSELAGSRSCGQRRKLGRQFLGVLCKKRVMYIFTTPNSWKRISSSVLQWVSDLMTTVLKRTAPSTPGLSIIKYVGNGLPSKSLNDSHS